MHHPHHPHPQQATPTSPIFTEPREGGGRLFMTPKGLTLHRSRYCLLRNHDHLCHCHCLCLCHSLCHCHRLFMTPKWLTQQKCRDCLPRNHHILCHYWYAINSCDRFAIVISLAAHHEFDDNIDPFFRTRHNVLISSLSELVSIRKFTFFRG